MGRISCAVIALMAWCAGACAQPDNVLGTEDGRYELFSPSEVIEAGSSGNFANVYHFFESRRLAVPSIATNTTVPASTSGYEFEALANTTFSGGVIPGPFNTEYEGQIRLLITTNARIEFTVENIHTFPSVNKTLTSSRSIIEDVEKNDVHTTSLSAFSSITQLAIGTVTADDGSPLDITPELLAAPMQIRIVMRIRGLTGQGAPQKEVIGVLTPFSTKVTWWQLNAAMGTTPAPPATELPPLTDHAGDILAVDATATGVAWVDDDATDDVLRPVVAALQVATSDLTSYPTTDSPTYATNTNAAAGAISYVTGYDSTPDVSGLTFAPGSLSNPAGVHNRWPDGYALIKLASSEAVGQWRTVLDGAEGQHASIGGNNWLQVTPSSGAESGFVYYTIAPIGARHRLGLFVDDLVLEASSNAAHIGKTKYGGDPTVVQTWAKSNSGLIPVNRLFPSLAGNAAKVLTVNSAMTGVLWAEGGGSGLPPYSATANAFLHAKGSARTWLGGELPPHYFSANKNNCLRVNAVATGISWTPCPVELPTNPTLTAGQHSYLQVDSAGTKTWLEAHAAVLAGLPALTGHGGNVLKVNAGATGLEWAAGGGGGGGGAGITLTARNTSIHGTQWNPGPNASYVVATFRSDSPGTGSGYLGILTTNASSVGLVAFAIGNGLCGKRFNGTAWSNSINSCGSSNFIYTVEFSGGGGGSSGPTLPTPGASGALQHLRVNAGGSAYELAAPPEGVPSIASGSNKDILQLTKPLVGSKGPVWKSPSVVVFSGMPDTRGKGNNALTLNSAGTALAWSPRTSAELPAISGQSEAVLRVKTDVSGVEWDKTLGRTAADNSQKLVTLNNPSGQGSPAEGDVWAITKCLGSGESRACEALWTTPATPPAPITRTALGAGSGSSNSGTILNSAHNLNTIMHDPATAYHEFVLYVRSGVSSIQYSLCRIAGVPPTVGSVSNTLTTTYFGAITSAQSGRCRLTVTPNANTTIVWDYSGGSSSKTWNLIGLRYQ